ncbi:PREDICTED: ubiquitin carboxyl-terminal hydrolase 35-like [Polistes dominula]|uniref:Ubiquitin carboxyl-terminal hydrolase 35-like n=1 Tax=Polistes dominula TaxID=743375 RepID=A0ABM1JGC0_POLDO|nr:PREDICTED: ubiquitin carboxyl-terminal hydrolase 35-like [Polistes dominula]
MGTGQIQRDIEHSLTLIVTGKPLEIAEGWAKLKKIEGNQVYEQANNCVDILKPLWDCVTNVNQIPGIISWYCKNVITHNSNVNTFVSDLTMFLKNTDIKKEMEDLRKILELLKDYDMFFCESNNYVELGEAIVISLANLSPPYQPLKNDEFNENVIKIQTLLCEICSKKQVLVPVCLKTLYKIISDKDKKQEPALALASVLKLNEPSEEAVDWIFESQCEDKLVQALRVLCAWLPNWKGNSLGRWIMEFIFGLERRKKDKILMEVLETMLKTIFSSSLESVHRHNASKIIFPILERQGSLRLLKIVINMIDQILINIDKSNIECIQDMTDIKKALKTKLTRSKDHISSQIILPVRSQSSIGKEILIGPTWTNERELDSFLESPKSITGKVGLSNLGNTCYMNSVLQALFMTREFCHEVLNYKSFNDNGEQVILKKLQDVFALLLYSNRITLSPNEMWNACRPASFLPGQQQDSSEFLCHLLDMLHEQERCATNDLISYQCKVDIQDNDNLPIEAAAVIKRWTTEENLTGNTILQRKTQSLADFTQGDELTQTQNLSDYHSDSTDSGIQSVGGEEISIPSSLVHRVLGGESKITYKCARCNTCSHNTDKFRDLQLCFPEELNENQEAISVQDLIDYYLAPEKLTGDNKYRCDKCRILCDAERIIKILQAPSHLILTLKHFNYDFETRLKTKLKHKVLYNNIIQLPVSTQPNSITETYQLYAAVVHSGFSMDYGHYFTYACDSKQNWYKFNDSFVSCTTLEDLKNLRSPDTPYILFYEKLGSSSNGIYEDKIELSMLSKHIQELVAKDRIAYIEELTHQPEKSQQSRYPITLFRRSDNSDDENPPFSNCRGPVNIQTNSRLC